MKRVAVVGLYSIPNMGDRILCEVSSYLAKTIRDDIEIVPVDVCPRFPSDYEGIEYVKYKIAKKMQRAAERNFKYEDGSRFRYTFEYSLWKIRLNRYYKKMLKGVDAIIFAGGGFLKFRTQGLNYYVEMILKIAIKHNIPVMMNSVGIEGFDESDIRCRNLKRIINSDVVKIITTRDDIEILENNYVTRETIKTGRVGDPALWSPECYNVERNIGADVFGINIIRERIFLDYGNKLTREELRKFYVDLIRKLDERNIKWMMFCNGMKSDENLARKVLNDLDIPFEDKMLPRPATSEELLEMIRNFKGIFGARLHACITAYSMDVPVTGFIWNEKTRIFADLIGKPENFFEEYELDVDKIVDRLVAAADEKYDTTLRDKMKEETVKYMREFIEKI